jgi:cyclopropane fatty-acyl-phospholipid synthase-like methyltransferase
MVKLHEITIKHSKTEGFNEMGKNIVNIKNHWNKVAKSTKTDPRGAMPDVNLRKLEFDAICKHVKVDDSLLDIGCGNGSCTIEFAKMIRGNVVGIDFARNMVKYAEDLLKEEDKELQKRVSFIVENILNLKLKRIFNKVISQRCLINLPESEMQIKALENIYQFLDINGIVLLSEDTLQGFNSVNLLRKQVGLEPITKRWHNTLINEDIFSSEPICSLFKLKDIIDFSSTYYMISRVINISYARTMKDDQDYYPELDSIAALLPPVGNFGLLRLIVLEKKD